MMYVCECESEYGELVWVIEQTKGGKCFHKVKYIKLKAWHT